MNLGTWSGRLHRTRTSRTGGRLDKSRKRSLSFDGLEARELLATLYVATSGSDAGPGSTSAPFRTIQEAVTAASSGDEIRVAEGTYTYDPGSDKFGPKKQFSYSSILGSSPVVAVYNKQVSILGGFSLSDWNTSDPADNPTIIDGQGGHRGVFVVG